MSTYVKVVNNIVTQTIVADASFFNAFVDNSPGIWMPASSDVGIGFSYNAEANAFYPPRPYPSWTISAPDWIWKPPVAIPNDGKMYEWSESLQKWQEPLEAAICRAKATVDQFAKNARIKIAGTSDPIEIAAWNNKLRIAKAVLGGSATPEDIESIQTEASLRGRGESVNDLCQKIVSYSSQYAIAVATVDGIQKKAHGTLDACQDQASINQVLDSLHKIADEQLARLL